MKRVRLEHAIQILNVVWMPGAGQKCAKPEFLLLQLKSLQKQRDKVSGYGTTTLGFTVPPIRSLVSTTSRPHFKKRCGVGRMFDKVNP